MSDHKGKGYIVIAQNNDEHDYIKQAYALALSIKHTQSKVRDVTICVTDKKQVPRACRHAFHKVVEIPWGDHASKDQWKINNKWKYYYMTPYMETVVLDTDMIFTSDVSHWWDMLSQRDMWFTTAPRTFRGEVITSDAYRKTFTANNLPNLYTAFMYFKQCDMAAEVFRYVNIIFNNWEKFYWEFLDHTRPKMLSGDVAFALAVKLLGITEACTAPLSGYPTFVHMKSNVQNVPEEMVTEDWTRHFFSFFADNGALSVGNYKQYLPFHYHVKHWLTDDIVSKLEKLNGK